MTETRKSNIFSVFFRPVDMTEGTPWKKIMIFAIPMLIGNIAQQLYNTVDSIVVGNYIGDNALAAVGSAGPIMNMLFVLLIGISTGASIVVSQYVGARQRENLSHSIGSAITLTLIATAIIMIVGRFIARPILDLLNTPPEIIDWGESYLKILFMGCAGMRFYNILSGILRGLGDSVFPLLFLVIATGINIALDIVFVRALGVERGVDGVAYATIIAQIISGTLCFIRLSRMTKYFDLKLKYLKFKGRLTTDILRLGLPSGFTQMIFSLAMVLVQSLINSFGATFIACNVIIMRIDGFAMMPNFSFGAAMTTYAGQNVGAGDRERVYRGTRQGAFIAVAVSAVLTGLVLIFGHFLMNLFTDTEDLIELSVHNIRILAAGYIAMGLTQALQGSMRGAGDTITPMWISLITTVAIRVPIAYAWKWLTTTEELPTGSSDAIFFSLLISWLIGALLTLVFYWKGKWRKRLDGGASPRKGPGAPEEAAENA